MQRQNAGGGYPGFFFREDKERTRFEKLFYELNRKIEEASSTYEAIRSYTTEFFIPKVKISENEQMLFDLANDDFQTVKFLEENVPKKKLYEKFYLMQVKKLNEKLDLIAYLQSTKH